MNNILFLSTIFTFFGGGDVVAADFIDSGYICHFETRCYEGLGCKDDEEFDVVINERGRKRPRIDFLNNSIPAIRQLDIDNPDTVNTISYVSDIFLNTLHLITIHDDGSARMSSHSFSDAAFTIESVGVCLPQ